MSECNYLAKLCPWKETEGEKGDIDGIILKWILEKYDDK
jgi:hypothetical protein